MANKTNFKKCVALTAIIGTVIAAFAAKLHFKKKYELLSSNHPSDMDDNLDTIDFEHINNDTPRDYVSIQINHKNDE
ncbi:MAG: hypothetical protein PHW47_06740 [Lachnospira sp.]|nr:hypothetical protein [Lachnospira sp.]